MPVVNILSIDPHSNSSQGRKNFHREFEFVSIDSDESGVYSVLIVKRRFKARVYLLMHAGKLLKLAPLMYRLIGQI